MTGLTSWWILSFIDLFSLTNFNSTGIIRNVSIAFVVWLKNRRFAQFSPLYFNGNVYKLIRIKAYQYRPSLANGFLSFWPWTDTLPEKRFDLYMNKKVVHFWVSEQSFTKTTMNGFKRMLIRSHSIIWMHAKGKNQIIQTYIIFSEPNQQNSATKIPPKFRFELLNLFIFWLTLRFKLNVPAKIQYSSIWKSHVSREIRIFWNGFWKIAAFFENF